MHRIIIKSLKTSCIIGIKSEERLNRQQLIIDIELGLDLSKAAGSDDISDTIDYDELAGKITNYIESSSFNLIEKLAYETARLAKDLTKADKVKVLVKKPAALKNADFAAVEFSL